MARASQPRVAALPDAGALQQLRRALLAFYAEHARDLPWRRTRDPYAIWVSEVMLQQTRVETVLRYYDRFLARFPTPAALAAADEDAVLASWSGLGYYRRARLLHTAVREVVAHYGGQVPEAPEARRTLPGVGRYTAGAIGSIAFARNEPLVDGNVARVFARLFGIETALGERDTEQRLWALAEALVEGPDPGALNQALMELGATLCSKAAPSCARCPVSAQCRAAQSGSVERLPVAKKRVVPKTRPVVLVAALDAQRKRVLLVRGAQQLFGGLWNLPMCDGQDASAAKSALQELGVGAKLLPGPLGSFDHVLTHRRLEVQLFAAERTRFNHGGGRGTRSVNSAAPGLRLNPSANGALILQPLDQLASLGISSLTRRALDQALTKLAP
jgi:A/G-specific adenine glycosylase